MEQNFQRSEHCTGTECLVEMGKLLNAQKIIGGSVGQVAGMYNFTLRMVDLETGKIDFTVYEDIENPKELLTGIRSLGRRLAVKYAEGQRK